MNTLEDLKGRCRIDFDTGCWIWAGALSPSNGGRTKQPRVHAPDFTKDESGQTLTVQTGNRAAWHLFTGKPIPKGYRVFKKTCCSNGLCVNPEHLQAGTTKEWGAMVAEKGEWRGQATRIAANRITGKARTSVTPELAREILASNETGRALQKRTGISNTVISRVRHGKLTSVQAVNNPFARLMA